jgi:hypothetical protein
MPFQGASYGGMMPRGGGAGVGVRGRGFFGAGATGARGGPKRKPAVSATDASGLQGGDFKKLNAPVDTWTSPPIAQQPLTQSVDVAVTASRGMPLICRLTVGPFAGSIYFRRAGRPVGRVVQSADACV